MTVSKNLTKNDVPALVAALREIAGEGANGRALWIALRTIPAKIRWEVMKSAVQIAA